MSLFEKPPPLFSKQVFYSKNNFEDDFEEDSDE